MLGVFLMMAGFVGLKERGFDMDRYVIVASDEIGVSGAVVNATELALLDLAEEVNNNIDLGYVPIGGIGCRMGSSFGAIYYQAMFLPEVDAEKDDGAWGDFSEAGHQCDRHGAIGQCSKCGKIPVSPTSP